MNRKIWIDNCKSVCSISCLSASHIELLSFSGFKIGKYIVTDDEIYNVKDVEEVIIRFYQDDGLTIKSSTIIGYKELIEVLPPRKEFDSLGIMMIPDFIGDLSYIPNLTLCRSCAGDIGRPVSVIGYQYEHKNLALKSGIISSFNKGHNGLSFIQYDGTIKPGNSGAPLIDAETGKVLGIVMNKELSLSKSYKELNRIIDSNLVVLRGFEGKMKLYDIDPIQVLVANQLQIKHISREFFMNATVKVGMALEIGHVIEYLEGKMEIDSDYSVLVEG